MKRALTYFCSLTVAFTTIALTPSADNNYPKPGEKVQWIEQTTAAADAYDPQAMWNLAEFLAKKDLNRRDYVTAIKYYQMAAETWANNDSKARAYFNIARIYHNSRTALVNAGLDYNSVFNSAIEYYEKALALSSGSFRDKCLLALGEIYRFSDWQKAKGYYNQISLKSPAEYCISREVLLYNSLGRIDKDPAVRRMLSQLENYTGDDFYKYYYLGVLYDNCGKNEKAVGYYSKAVKATRDRAKAVDAQLRIAQINWDKDHNDYGNISDAYELMDKFRSPKTYFWLAWLLWHNDKEFKAAEFYKKGLAMYVQQGADYYFERGLPDLRGVLDMGSVISDGLCVYYKDLPSKLKIYLDYERRLGAESAW